MALLAWLKREGFGTYASVDEFTGELARRSTSALGALGAAMFAPPEDLQEAARGNGAGICTELVRDLRVARGARLAALRAVLMAGAGAHLAPLCAGSSDLLNDVRLPQADRSYLVRSGLDACLQAAPRNAVNLEIARAAAVAGEAARSLGRELVAEVLAKHPPDHVAVLTLRHAAFDEPLPPELEGKWLELLGRQHRAAKNASPAAKRLGTAPEWPPLVAESMRPLLARAEAAAPAAAAAKPAGQSLTAPGAPATPAPANDAAAAKDAGSRKAAAPSPDETVPAKQGARRPPARVEEAGAAQPAAPAPPPRVQPPLKSRARVAAPEDTYVPDSVQVPAAALRSTGAAAAGEPAQKAASEAPAAASASAPRPGPVASGTGARAAAGPALRALRFGEHVELVASRGTRALERLIGAFDARSAVVGTEKALEELDRAATARGASNVSGPMLDELMEFASSAKTPSPWRRAAKTVLARLGPDRAAALGGSATA